MIRVERAGPIEQITLADPLRRNPLSLGMLEHLDAALQAAGQRQDCRVVVLAGDGPAFCAGLDLKEAGGDMHAATAALIRVQRRIASLTVPVVVRVHGAARAGGLGLLAAADVVISADDVDFAFPEVSIGVAPAVISATLLPRLDPRAAADLMLTARRFPASEAARIGLISRCVPRVMLDAEVSAVAEAIASGIPAAVSETKRLLSQPLIDALDADGDRLAALSAQYFARASAARSHRDIKE